MSSGIIFDPSSVRRLARIGNERVPYLERNTALFQFGIHHNGSIEIFAYRPTQIITTLTGYFW